jgi:uncharacterized protein YxeA
MIDSLAILLGFFLICLLVLIMAIGIKFFYSLVTAGQSNNSYSKETDNQLRENSQEDSQADLYMSEEHPDDDSLMFPEEFD